MDADKCLEKLKAMNDDCRKMIAATARGLEGNVPETDLKEVAQEQKTLACILLDIICLPGGGPGGN